MNDSEKESVSTPPESGFKRFVRRLLRWTLGLLIVFGLGVLTAIFTLYLPANEKLRQANAALGQSKQQIAGLKALEGDKQTLQAKLDTANLYVAMLSVLVDVTGARLALASNDPAEARVHLSDTAAKLENLGALLKAEQSKIAVSMQKRLENALKELESDQYAAQSDLNVLANNLVQLRIKYFAEP